MSSQWLILETRYGSSIREPTPVQLTHAIAELYHENEAGMIEADYEEHAAASFRCGADDGPMFVITINRGGVADFEQWADQDYEMELDAPLRREAVSQEVAFALWQHLTRCEIEPIKALMNAS